MAKCLSQMQRLCDRIPDWIWPHLTGNAEDPPEYEERFSTKHTESLTEAENVLQNRQNQVAERIRSVESKLIAMLTLTSVLSAVIGASLAATTALGKVEAETEVFAWAAVILVTYVSFQVLRALWSTVAGLTRRSYKQLSLIDIVPQGEETAETYRIRLLNLQSDHLSWNEWAVNQMVGEMAVAHTALKNALTVVFLLIVLVSVMAGVNMVHN